jgi:hypothetical protein
MRACCRTRALLLLPVLDRPLVGPLGLEHQLAFGGPRCSLVDQNERPPCRRGAPLEPPRAHRLAVSS